MIDTVGPKVTSFRFDRAAGRIYATVADELSGLDPLALVDGSNYRFSPLVSTKASRKLSYSMTSVTASDGMHSTDPRTLIVTINRGRPLPFGRYRFTIDSASGDGSHSGNGVCDLAGNALDGEFHGYFNSGNLRPGGNFVVGLDASRQRVFGPVPSQDGYATPVTPPGTTGQESSHGSCEGLRRQGRRPAGRPLRRDHAPESVALIERSTSMGRGAVSRPSD